MELHGRAHLAGCSLPMAAVLLHFLGQSSAIPTGVTHSGVWFAFDLHH